MWHLWRKNKTEKPMIEVPVNITSGIYLYALVCDQLKSKNLIDELLQFEDLIDDEVEDLGHVLSSALEIADIKKVS